MTRRPKQPSVLSCGVVVVRWWEATPWFLLLRVYRHWDFPKGIKEADETPIEAAIREVEEETTLTDLVFHWGYDFRQTPVYRGNKAARFFIAESPGGAVTIPINPELGWPEHHDFEWFRFDDAKEKVADRLRPILVWANEVVVRQPPARHR